MLLVSTLFRCCINRPFESIIKFCIKEIVKYSFESQNTVALFNGLVKLFVTWVVSDAASNPRWFGFVASIDDFLTGSVNSENIYYYLLFVIALLCGTRMTFGCFSRSLHLIYLSSRIFFMLYLYYLDYRRA